MVVGQHPQTTIAGELVLPRRGIENLWIRLINFRHIVADHSMAWEILHVAAAACGINKQRSQTDQRNGTGGVRTVGTLPIQGLVPLVVL
jgi:hypothetical protein